MALQPKTLTFGNFKVWLGNDDATVWTAPCGFTQKSLTLSADVATENIPPCDDPDAATWTGRGVTALSAGVAGSGVLATENYATWVERFLGVKSFPVRVELAASAANGGGWWQGLAVLSNLTHNATLGPKTELSITLDSDGPWAWTPAAA